MTASEDIEKPTILGPIESPLPAVPEAYHRVVASAQLSLIRMVEQTFRLDAGFFSAPDPELGYGRNIKGHRFDDGQVTTLIEWWVEARHGDVNVLVCRASWVVVYDGLQGCDEEAVFEFAQRVGALACYPYFRALVAHLTWAAGVSIEPLPVVRGNAFPIAPLKRDSARAAAASDKTMKKQTNAKKQAARAKKTTRR